MLLLIVEYIIIITLNINLKTIRIGLPDKSLISTPNTYVLTIYKFTQLKHCFLLVKNHLSAQESVVNLLLLMSLLKP